VLKLLSEGYSPRRVAEILKVSRAALYKWRNEDEEFGRVWVEAAEEGIDRLEDEARRRAVEGVDKSVYYRGKLVGHIRKYSDGLLILLLKARRPHVYRDVIKR
jgi:predicted transcriptional regulator